MLVYYPALSEAFKIHIERNLEGKGGGQLIVRLVDPRDVNKKALVHITHVVSDELPVEVRFHWKRDDVLHLDVTGLLPYGDLIAAFAKRRRTIESFIERFMEYLEVALA